MPIRRSIVRSLVLVMLLLLSWRILAQHDPSPEVDPNKFSIPPAGISIPMLDFGGRPVVEVRMNGKGPFRFILDTGAKQTVVDSKLNDELSLPGSFNGTVIHQLQLGAASLTDFPVMVAPISAMFRNQDAPRGVLSALAFPGYLITFDYPKARLILRPGALHEPDGKTVFSYDAEAELPTAPVRVAGKELRVHLDTGAPYALSLPTKYKEQLPLTGPLKEGPRARSHAAEFPVYKGTLKGEIEIGDYKLATHDILFTDVVPRPDMVPQGQIGGAALRDFEVTLDSKNRRFELMKPASNSD